MGDPHPRHVDDRIADGRKQVAGADHFGVPEEHEAVAVGVGLRRMVDNHGLAVHVPLRQRVAPRQRDRGSRPHALRLCRRSAPGDAGPGRDLRVVRRPPARVVLGDAAHRRRVPGALSDVVFPAGVGGGRAVTVPAHDVALRARLSALQPAPRAGDPPVDRPPPVGAHPGDGGQPHDRSRGERPCTRSKCPKASTSSANPAARRSSPVLAQLSSTAARNER